jgi:hypothetical protein
MNVKLPDNIRSMYTDAYKLHETFCSMGNTPEEWTRCTGTMNAVCIHHGNHPLMISLAIAVLDQLERDRRALNGS